MNKNEFFNILMDELKDIPEKKLQDIIWHYENLFDLEIQNGKSEEEMVESLGNIDTLINKYKDSALLTDYMKDSLNDSSDSRIYNNESNYSGNYIVSTEKHSNTSNNKNDYTDTNNTNKNKDDSKFYKNNNTKKSININSILKICILILSIIIFTPIFTTIIGIILGIFGTAIGMFFGSIGLLIGGTFTSFAGIPTIPNFISNFPYPVLVLFCLGTVTLSIILFILFCYVFKASVIGIKKLYSILMS